MAKQNYEEFVEKFKPKPTHKLTTDDCYTPDVIYETVKDWAVKEYNLEGREIVRPFYPGGDYEAYEYPDGCVVIDNPPFSISAEIREFYTGRKIDFFLFAPYLTLFRGARSVDAVNFIVTHNTITYHNGAKVNTAFVTSLGSHFIRTAPELRRLIKEAEDKNLKEEGKKKPRHLYPKYKYPDTVISATLLGKVCSVDFTLERSECHFICGLDSQKPKKKTIFGGGFLISELKAAELKAAEEKAAVEEKIAWELSDRELEIIKE